MAKVNRWLAAFTALILASTAGAANLPDEALRAETEKRWSDAIEIYQLMLAADPDRADLWQRIADIHVARGNALAGAAALAEAAQLRPDDAALQVRSSQAYAASNQPREALAAMRRAVTLAPGNVDYLRAQAQLASWNSDLDLAIASHQALLEIDAGDREAQRALAHALFMAGRLDDAVRAYTRYLEAHPDDHDALLAAADAQMYRGNYHEADRLQTEYLRQAGETPAYRQARAGLLARSGRPRAALALIEPRSAEGQEDYDLNLSRTLALHADRQPRAALDSLATLDRLAPSRPETRGARLQVETPQRPHVDAGVRYSNDTDDVEILRLQLGGTITPGARSRLSILASRTRLDAPIGSGLEASDDEGTIDLDEIALGGHYQLASTVAVRSEVGVAESDRDDSTTTYRIGLDLWPDDRVQLGIERAHDVLAVSPRTVDLFIERDRTRLTFGWQPGDRSYFDGVFAYDLYDDGNRRSEVTLAPRWAVQRTQSYNVDLGLRAQWSSFRQDLGNGYYDPDQFFRGWLVGYAYWKLSEDDGLGIVLGAGPERDMTADDAVRLGGDAYVEGTFGIYRDWLLKASGGYGGRFTQNDTGSAAGDAGSYRGYFVGLDLSRRI